MLCNALIQPHFDYASCAWYPNLNKKLKQKLQITQNKCIRFCLQLGNRKQVSTPEFGDINWLPIEDRFHQCISSTIFKFFCNKCPSYMSEIFTPVGHSQYNTRNSYLKLQQPFRKTTIGQKSLSFIGPSIWNKLPESLKKTKNVNTFKHNFKQHYFSQSKQNKNNPLTS